MYPWLTTQSRFRSEKLPFSYYRVRHEVVADYTVSIPPPTSSLHIYHDIKLDPTVANMRVNPVEIPFIPEKPLFHSRKHHDSYNGARHQPLSVWVRSSTIRITEHGDHNLVYEIVLFYGHHRACTIYRTWDDFRALERGLSPWKRSACFRSQHDAHGLQAFLGEAIVKRPRECAMEYFLRRRMDDCTGHC